MMEEFEKWRDKQRISGRSHKADARVWRAALEMVLENDDAYCCGDYSDASGEWEECPTKTVIEKELSND